MNVYMLNRSMKAFQITTSPKNINSCLGVLESWRQVGARLHCACIYTIALTLQCGQHTNVSYVRPLEIFYLDP